MFRALIFATLKPRVNMLRARSNLHADPNLTPIDFCHSQNWYGENDTIYIKDY